MGASVCCLGLKSPQTSLKRAEYSLESSTASEMSTHGDYSESSSYTTSSNSFQPNSVTYSISQSSICCSQANCASHGKLNCSFTHCSIKCPLPRVGSGGLTPIEEEPKHHEVHHRLSSTYASIRGVRSRTRSNDSFESCASSSFGSMRNYQQFVLTRS